MASFGDKIPPVQIQTKVLNRSMCVWSISGWSDFLGQVIIEGLLAKIQQ